MSTTGFLILLVMSILVLLVLSVTWIIYTHRESNRLRKSLRRYDSLVSLEQSESQLNLAIHLKEREIASLNEDYNQLILKYENLHSQEEVEAKLNSDILLRQNELDKISQEEGRLKVRLGQLQQQVYDLEEEAHIQSFGFYQPKYDFINSGDYDIQLRQIKSEQKEMIRSDQAAICRTSWVVKNSEKEGQKLAKNFLKLVLTIFNGECDGIISKVKPSTINSSEEKIRKLFQNLNKSSKVIDCEITERYLSLKLRELHLQFESTCKKQEEKDQEQEIRVRMKQEEKERLKTEEEAQKIREAEAKEKKYQQQLEEALKRQQFVAEQERAQLEIEIQQLRQNLTEATSDKEEAKSRSAMIKSGYIYVISNIGSLGRDIYRICMTKRSSNEDEYIRSMTPEVPFPFDIHFKFISEDASDTLNRLHGGVLDVWI